MNHEEKLLISLINIQDKYSRLRLEELKENDLKSFTLKQMLQRLRIALAQVKAGKTSKSLLNENHQIIYCFYQAKEITKKVCNTIMNSIKL